MIRLTPQVELEVSCPDCAKRMDLGDWSISGVHNTVTATCSPCGRSFEQELPVNCGLFYPGLLDARSGQRRDALPFSNWFLRGMTGAFAARRGEELPFEVEPLRPLSRPKLAILSTLDHTYGHSLFELFNAQHYLGRDDTDLVVLVQRPLRWLVPDGCAQIWTTDLPFSKASGWNTWLADRIRREVRGRDNVHLCRAFVQADSSDFDIAKFTRIEPFPLDAWDARLARPTVTFIWRTDRFWNRLVPRVVDNRFTRKLAARQLTALQLEVQRQWIIRLAARLKKAVPTLDFAVAGMDDRRFAFPSWIPDLRHPTHTDETARAMCQRYADSHVVIGCNGSSLLMPSALAGATINLVPGDQWAVSAGTFAFRITDVADTHFRHVMLPSESTVERVASVATSIMRDRSLIRLHTASEWRDHTLRRDPFDWARFRIDAFANGRHFNDEQGLITFAARSGDAGA